jgi:hypothetical protein
MDAFSGSVFAPKEWKFPSIRTDGFTDATCVESTISNWEKSNPTQVCLDGNKQLQGCTDTEEAEFIHH